MLEKQVSELIDKAVAGLSKLTPEVGAAVGKAIFVDSLLKLIVAAVLCPLLIYGLYRLSIYCWQRGDANDGKDIDLFGPPMIIAMIAAGILAIVDIVLLLSPSMWLGLTDPKAYLAKQVLEKLLGG